MSCGVGFGCSLDLGLPWLWRRLAAVAPIGSLASGAAIKKNNNNITKNKEGMQTIQSK